MENASKALMMAAGVLLGIMLLSVMIYVFRAGAKVNESYDNTQISYHLELHNSKFEFYNRQNNTVMDMISLANIAYDINKESDYDSGIAVKVEIVIGNKTFEISNLKSRDLSSRNKIWDGSNEISIYDLTNLTLSELGVTRIDTKDVSGSGTITKSSKSISSSSSEGEEKLTLTKLVDGKTTYKYLFEVLNPETDITYNETTGRISSIRLNAYIDNVTTEW